MLSSDIPSKFNIPFASNAQSGFITPIPQNAQPNGRASLVTGFAEINFEPLASGGIPPWGADFNGLENQITAWLRYIAAGGSIKYDAAFQTAIGGYPAGAFIMAASGLRFWISTAENNVTNPDTGGAGWIPFPDVIVQKQAGNYAVDTGSVNHYAITLDPAKFATTADLVGAPIRVKAGAANSITNPDIAINGLPPLTMINSNGQPLLIAQIARAGQIFEGIPDDAGKFQVTSPAPITASASGLLPGQIIIWSAETPPAGTLECDGTEYNVSDYPNLFNVIKWRYGGNGTSTFRVPDYRGRFHRGWDHGAGRDPNAGTRTNSGNPAVGGPTGNQTGDHVGTNQAYEAAFGPAAISIDNPTFSYAAQASSGGFFSALSGVVITLAADYYQNELFGGMPFGNYPFPPRVQEHGGTPYMLTSSSTEEGIVAASMQGTMTVSGDETRPLNINVMYVIAY